MLIIEGTDLTGKTTLCRRLVEELNKRSEWGGYHYGHLSRLPPGWDHYWSYVARMARRRVQDRFHDSDIAYRRALREESQMEDAFKYGLVQAKLNLFGAYKVAIVADKDLLLQRHKNRGDQMYDVDVVIKANLEFNGMADKFDEVIYTHREHPWTDDFDVNRIIDEYLSRQSQLSLLLYNGGRTD